MRVLDKLKISPQEWKVVMMSEQQIGPGTQVTLHFSLKLEEGAVVDSTFDKAPASFAVGDGNLPEGFEELLHGLTAGSKQTFTVGPEKAFGQHNPSNVQAIARSQFSDDMQLEEGMMISFSDKANGELPGVVASFDEKNVQVDFNHPLAGRTLIFDVEVISVVDAPENVSAE